MEKRKVMGQESRFIKKIKQRIYKWHRTLGIVTLVPAIFWTLSGIMHPFMAHFFKPEIANNTIENIPFKSGQIKFSLQETLAQNKMNSLKNFRIVRLKDRMYYQVKTIDNIYRYFDTKTAIELKNGDQKYAKFLARYFLDDQKNEISNIQLLTEFSAQYKYVNRYLPVYKITFDRPDNMKIYIETNSSKLATFNPKSRQAFLWIFDTFHNWGFIDAIANSYLRISVMLIFLSVILFSAVSGILIYGFMWRRFKTIKSTNSDARVRKNHRKIGVSVSLVTLTFTFSGAYHVLQKWEPNVLPKMVFEPVLKIHEIKTPSTLIAVDLSKLIDISLIKFDKSYFFQCELFNSKTEKKEKIFINASTNKWEKNSELQYAKYLVSIFHKRLNKSNAACCDEETSENCVSDFKFKSTSILNDFDKREYGFVNKRLPVVKIQTDLEDQTTYFIETSTSRLAAIVNNSSRREGYSFAIFHKFLFMEWAGKNIRDFTTVIAALGVFVVSIFGLALFLKRRKHTC